MAGTQTETMLQSVESLLVEKEAVAAKEKELIDGLNAALGKMGYRVVPTNSVAKPQGRPAGSGKASAPAAAGSGNGRRRGRPAKAEGAPKRRGRPPKQAKESE
jgi:hypothetical protein